MSVIMTDSTTTELAPIKRPVGRPRKYNNDEEKRENARINSKLYYLHNSEKKKEAVRLYFIENRDIIHERKRLYYLRTKKAKQDKLVD